MPIKHGLFSGIISQNLEHKKTFCNDLNNPFHFASHNWMIKQ